MKNVFLCGIINIRMYIIKCHINWAFIYAILGLVGGILLQDLQNFIILVEK